MITSEGVPVTGGGDGERGMGTVSYPVCLPALCPLPQVFAGLLVGAMLPYWFSAMTMKSVGKAALAMVEEVSRRKGGI